MYAIYTNTINGGCEADVGILASGEGAIIG